MKKPVQFSRSGNSSSFKKFDGRAGIKAMYDDKWERYSKIFLKLNRQCYSCGAPSQVTDHLVPHKGDQVLFKKLDNHIPLCTRCHNYITAKFDRNFKRGNSIDGKLTWMHNNRMKNGLAFKVIVLPKYE